MGYGDVYIATGDIYIPRGTQSISKLFIHTVINKLTYTFSTNELFSLCPPSPICPLHTHPLHKALFLQFIMRLIF